MSAPHTFEATKAVGAEGEARVRAYLEGAGYRLRPIGFENGGEILSPDFLIESHSSGDLRGRRPLVSSTLEVKCDKRSHETGNICLELLSNMGSGRPGWLYSTPSNFIAYLCQKTGRLLIFETEGLRRAVRDGLQHGRVAPCRNEKFSSLNLLAPWDEVAAIAVHASVIP